MRCIYPEIAGVSPSHLPASCSPEGVTKVLMKVALILHLFSLKFSGFLLSRFFFTNNSYKIRTAGERIGHFTHYHFHPLQRHLDISQSITAESSPLHIEVNRETLVSDRKSLTAKLRAI